jgi:TonB family protein
MYNVAMRLNYQMKNFPEAIRDATELRKLQPLDDIGTLVLIQSYYNLNDFASAAATAVVFVAATRAAGKEPSMDLLALLEKSEAALKNAPAIHPIPLTTHAVTADDYPPVSIQLQEQGKVGIRYLVKEDGSVGDCFVFQSSGKIRLDDAACTMVKRRWTFKPALQHGKPVAEFLTGEIVFQLK